MSPNTNPIMIESLTPVYAGLDIAKASLQLHFQNRQRSVPNTAKAHAQIIAWLRTEPRIHVICEATGGYERAIVAALHAAGIPVSVMNPGHIRHFALSLGRRAKNDPLDAAVLTQFGRSTNPAPTTIPNAALVELRALVQWRDQLKEQLARARQYAEQGTLSFALRQQGKLVRHLEKQIAGVEKELARVLAQTPKYRRHVEQLCALDGVGILTAVSVLSHMPELGQLNRGRTAALAGLAPWTRQSGPWEGQRHIGGGRAVVRRALYMSAVSLARSKDTVLGAFYHRLREAGKPAKVALTAVMRRLLLQMNKTLKDHALETN